MDPLADLVVPKLGGQLVAGNLVALTFGSFAEEVVVDAVFKVTCRNTRGPFLA